MPSGADTARFAPGVKEPGYVVAIGRMVENGLQLFLGRGFNFLRPFVGGADNLDTPRRVNGNPILFLQNKGRYPQYYSSLL